MGSPRPIPRLWPFRRRPWPPRPRTDADSDSTSSPQGARTRTPTDSWHFLYPRAAVPHWRLRSAPGSPSSPSPSPPIEAPAACSAFSFPCAAPPPPPGNGRTRATMTAPPPSRPAPPAADVDLATRRYWEDMAGLPDHGGMDEFREVAVEGFGAAILAAYGWSEGEGVGRSNRTADAKVVIVANKACGRRGLGSKAVGSDHLREGGLAGATGCGGKKSTENV
ncbi:hypothetical protein ACP4OV_002591 [Aristida adscensionis]